MVGLNYTRQIMGKNGAICFSLSHSAEPRGRKGLLPLFPGTEQARELLFQAQIWLCTFKRSGKLLLCLWISQIKTRKVELKLKSNAGCGSCTQSKRCSHTRGLLLLLLCRTYSHTTFSHSARCSMITRIVISWQASVTFYVINASGWVPPPPPTVQGPYTIASQANQTNFSVVQVVKSILQKSKTAEQYTRTQENNTEIDMNYFIVPWTWH